MYDLAMEKDFMLNPGDHEAENFALWYVVKIRQALVAGEFKPNCSLVLPGFLIRHGLLSPEEERDTVKKTVVGRESKKRLERTLNPPPISISHPY